MADGKFGYPFGPKVGARYAPEGGLVPQGISAELIADKWQISRDEMDALGMILDATHLCEETFWQALDRYAETLAPDHMYAGIARIKLGRALLRQRGAAVRPSGSRDR